LTADAANQSIPIVLLRGVERRVLRIVPFPKRADVAGVLDREAIAASNASVLPLEKR
jgi:hypothetical protein